MFSQLLAQIDPLAILWWNHLVRIILYFGLALALHLLAWRISGRLVRLGRFRGKRQQLSPERMRTMRGILANTVSFMGFAAAFLALLSEFAGAGNVVWMVGLFSAAFGLGARPLISDFLTGVSFIFEDTFSVGEKVELLDIEGVVEAVNLRTTLLRSPTGELYVVPNGEIRTVRNFSRGRFSIVELRLKLAGADLNQALDLLDSLSKEAVLLLPNLLEPWKTISETGAISQSTELLLVAKARFGKAAEMRPRLLALVHERLAEQGIQLAS